MFSTSTLVFFYGDVVEEEPHQIPKPLGRPVYVGCLVASAYCGNVITSCFHSGILLFVNNALINSFSKRQKIFKSSMFGSELVALGIWRDMIMEIRFKLKMFGVPMDVPANVLCVSNGVVKNINIPESTLSKEAQRNQVPLCA